MDAFQGTILKHIYRKKGEPIKDRILDLDKAIHYIEKYKEAIAAGLL